MAPRKQKKSSKSQSGDCLPLSSIFFYDFFCQCAVDNVKLAERISRYSLTHVWSHFFYWVNGFVALLTIAAVNHSDPYACKLQSRRKIWKSMGASSNKRSFVATGFDSKSAKILIGNCPPCPPASGVSSLSIFFAPWVVTTQGITDCQHQ